MLPARLQTNLLLAALCSNSLLAHYHQHSHHHHENPTARANHLIRGMDEDRMLQEDENITYCGATDLWEKDFTSIKSIYDDYFSENNDRRVLQGTTTEIPVFVHVVTDNQGRGSVSDASISAQMEVLNEAFAPTFSFSLVRVDRVANNAWFESCFDVNSRAAREMTSTLRQGGSGTLNFYTCNTPSNTQGVLLGRATFPFFYADDPSSDGIFCYFETLPNGRFGPRFSGGVTAVHEVGHWLGLFHTFESFGGTSGCPRGDDVSDTASQRVSGDSVVAGNTCPVGLNVDTCPDDEGLDPLRNFMDYTDDSCKDFDNDEGFTPGQVERMVASWNLFREVDDTPDSSTMDVEVIVETEQMADVYIEFRYDRNFDETSWAIFDSSGQRVVGIRRSRGRALVSGTVSMPVGEYTLIILDVGGDGTCCKYGAGSALIQVNGVAVVESDGQFGERFEQSFIVESTSTVTGVEGGQTDGTSGVQALPRLLALLAAAATLLL